jgi:hypothetical protein
MIRPFFEGSIWEHFDRLPTPHDDPAREWTDDQNEKAEADVFWQRIGSFKVRA